jgi:hypothetical protein
MADFFVKKKRLGVVRRKRQRPCGLWRSPGVLITHRIIHRPIQPLVLVPGCPGSRIFRLS